MSYFQEFWKGIWKENPVLVLMLGMCPTLAVSSSAKNALGMGLATTFVLVGSNMVISMVRKVVPDKVRIPCYIVIIAVFVTIVEMLMAAYAPAELNRTAFTFRSLWSTALCWGGGLSPPKWRDCFRPGRSGHGLWLHPALMALGAVREFGGRDVV